VTEAGLHNIPIYSFYLLVFVITSYQNQITVDLTIWGSRKK